jgi:hypothetical protein
MLTYICMCVCVILKYKEYDFMPILHFTSINTYHSIVR